MNELTCIPLPSMSTGEFLAWSGHGSGRKFHLVDGEVRAMSPASSVHGRIQANLGFLLETAARAAGSRLGVITEAAVIPALTARDDVRVPDLLMTEAEAAQGEVAVPCPVVIVEILSPGNAPVTRENVRAYATLASVREILVVSATRMAVEVHRHGEHGSWPSNPGVIERGAQLEVRCVGLICPVEEVYRGTWLAAPDAPRPPGRRS